MILQPIMRVVLCAALVPLCVADAGLFPTQPVAGQEARPTTLHGAAALEQLKRDGQYESLQAAMDQARFSVNRTAHTPLGRAAWHAPNPAAGYDADVTEAGVIEAEDHEAAYPLTIDPLFTLQQKLLAADGAADDRLGWSVALSGNTALVGAPYDDAPGADQGSAYVFARNGATWTQQQHLTDTFNADEHAAFEKEQV